MCFLVDGVIAISPSREDFTQLFFEDFQLNYYWRMVQLDTSIKWFNIYLVEVNTLVLDADYPST